MEAFVIRCCLLLFDRLVEMVLTILVSNSSWSGVTGTVSRTEGVDCSSMSVMLLTRPPGLVAVSHHDTSCEPKIHFSKVASRENMKFITYELGY